MSLLTTIVLLVVLAVIVVVAVILILSLTRMQQRKLVKTFNVDVANRGNARSRYELWADDASHELAFEFMLNGARLGQAQSATTGAPVGQNLLSGKAGAKQPPVRAGQNLKASAQNAGEKVSGFNETVGGILDTLGHILPGGAGSGLLSLSYRMRSGQAAVDRTQRVSAQAKAMVAGRQAASPMGGDSDYGGPSDSNPMAASDNATGTPSTSAAITHPQTAFVEPGKQLQLSLVIRPVARLKVERVAFNVYSKSLEAQDTEAIAQEGAALFKGMTGIMFYLPQIVVGAVALVLVIVLLAVVARA